MKKIRLWKLTLLYIVSLGFYEFIWLARRRDELTKKTKIKLPSKRWMIGIFIAWIANVAITFALPFFNSDTGSAIFLAYVILFTLIYVATLVIKLWWLWSFFKAASSAINNKVTFGWLIAYILLLGPAYIFVLQFYFNRKNTSQDKPTKKFVTLSIIGFVLLQVAMFIIALTSMLSMMKDAGLIQPRVSHDTPEMVNALKKSSTLDKKYTACINKLNIDFVEVTNETEAAYSTAYDNCETIRLEQNQAADLYNKLLNIQRSE